MLAYRKILGFAFPISLQVFCLLGSFAQQGPAIVPLSVEEVVKLSQAGMSEDVIITRIKKHGKAFDLSTDEMLELKKSGLSDNVIKFLLDPSQPYAPAPPPPPASANPAPLAAPKPPPPAKKYPEDAYALRVPLETGLYRFPQNAPEKIDIKTVLGENEGAGLGKVLMKKGKVIGYLVGPLAKARVTDLIPVLYMRLPEGKGIDEVVLAALDRKNDRREIDMGPPGPKPELKAEAMRPFDSVEVGPSLFRLVPGKLGKGEYMFFLLGSAEPPKGSYGKGYDFGIEIPEVKKKR